MSGTVGTLTRPIYNAWLAELEVRPKGVGALRSLCDGGVIGECCLGVLADIIDPEGWGTMRVHRAAWHGESVDLRDGSYGPSLVVGLDAGIQDDLIRVNDASPTFEPVIAYIRENIEPVEVEPCAFCDKPSIGRVAGGDQPPEPFCEIHDPTLDPDFDLEDEDDEVES